MREHVWIAQAHPLHDIRAACDGASILRIAAPGEEIWFVPVEMTETRLGHKVSGYTVEGDRVGPCFPVTKRHEEALYSVDKFGTSGVLSFDNPKNPVKIKEQSPISGSDAIAV